MKILPVVVDAIQSQGRDERESDDGVWRHSGARGGAIMSTRLDPGLRRDDATVIAKAIVIPAKAGIQVKL